MTQQNFPFDFHLLKEGTLEELAHGPQLSFDIRSTVGPDQLPFLCDDPVYVGSDLQKGYRYSFELYAGVGTTPGHYVRKGAIYSVTELHDDAANHREIRSGDDLQKPSYYVPFYPVAGYPGSFSAEIHAEDKRDVLTLEFGKGGKALLRRETYEEGENILPVSVKATRYSVFSLNSA